MTESSSSVTRKRKTTADIAELNVEIRRKIAEDDDVAAEELFEDTTLETLTEVGCMFESMEHYAKMMRVRVAAYIQQSYGTVLKCIDCANLVQEKQAYTLPGSHSVEAVRKIVCCKKCYDDFHAPDWFDTVGDQIYYIVIVNSPAMSGIKRVDFERIPTHAEMHSTLTAKFSPNSATTDVRISVAGKEIVADSQALVPSVLIQGGQRGSVEFNLILPLPAKIKKHAPLASE